MGRGLHAVYGVKGVHVDKLGLDGASPPEGAAGALGLVEVAHGDAKEAVAMHSAGDPGGEDALREREGGEDGLRAHRRMKTTELAKTNSWDTELKRDS